MPLGRAYMAAELVVEPFCSIQIVPDIRSIKGEPAATVTNSLPCGIQSYYYYYYYYYYYTHLYEYMYRRHRFYREIGSALLPLWLFY